MQATLSPFDVDESAANPRPHANEPEYDSHAGWVECSLIGDIYYRAMSTWMASRQTVGNVYDIYTAGVQYEAAIDRFLELSLTAPITSECRLNRAGAMLYKSHLVREIDYLASRINMASESGPSLEAVEPWPPITQKPSVRPEQLDSDVTITFRETIAA